MAKTLLTRISKVDQYDAANKTVLWEDPTESRWQNVYGQLTEGDHIIFIGAEQLKGKLLIGSVKKMNDKQSVFCENTVELACLNDQFLQLHEIYPELISRVKANFQPFIHPHEVNIQQLIDDIKAKHFVSYYILFGITKYNENENTFNLNDRIVLIDERNQFENVRLRTENSLKHFPAEASVNISVEGMTLDEMLEKNKSIKRKSAKSNNVRRIKKIQEEIIQDRLYKFNSFFSYYDALFNKRVYDNGGSSANGIQKIRLNENETIYKVSMSGKDIHEEAFTYFNDKNLIIVHSKTKAKGTSYQTQGDTFAKQMKVGDYFYLCRGNSNLEVIGKITSETEECEYKDFGDQGWLQRSYEVVADAETESAYQEEKKWWTPNDNSTCIIIPKHEIGDANTKIFVPFFNTEFEYEGSPSLANNNSVAMNRTLNQILFGPPGTGKTYNTINKALEIIGENIEGKTRQEVKDLFDAKLNERQIVFTTFHQSMSYEDFIEGIKPIEPEKEGDQVIYRIEYGVFRNLCIEASFAIAQLRETKTTEEVLDFSILYDQFTEGVEEKILNGQQVKLDTKSGGTVIVESISQKGNFLIKHHQGTRTYTVSKPRLTKLQAVIKNLNNVSNINDQFRAIIGGSNSSAYWSVLNAIKKEKQTKTTNNEARTYTFDDKKEVVLSLSKSDYKNKNGKPFVLIIDEINRGNISQIFGELISLIEEDKRLGKKEALEATLPYSKEKFGVPPNLYIIGTMNTADRSVEALDAALRRRFSFEEMPPKYDLSELDYEYTGIKAYQLLKTINSRIEKLLDKDHKIGHSYFILNGEQQAENKLITSFYKNIIPLLQEYFFGDFGKIGLVLGDGFVTLKEWDKAEDSFADFNQESASDFEDRPIYEIIDYRNANHDYKLKNKEKKEIEMTFEKAIKRLMKQDFE